MSKIKIIKLIGAGSFGEVYKCKYNNKFLAIKVINYGQMKKFNFLELEIMNKYKNKFLNQAFQIKINKKEKNLIIFQPLLKKIDKIKLDNHNSIKLIKDITEALKFLHKNNIIHGDIKKDNILYDGQNIKLIDYSMSKKINNYEMFHHVSYTRTHRAPEIIKNEPWDKRAEIWALGCSLYEIFYGEPLFNFKKEKNKDVLLKIIVDVLSCIKLKNNNIIDYIILNCLKLNKDERITLEEITYVLEKENYIN